MKPGHPVDRGLVPVHVGTHEILIELKFLDLRLGRTGGHPERSGVRTGVRCRKLVLCHAAPYPGRELEQPLRAQRLLHALEWLVVQAEGLRGSLASVDVRIELGPPFLAEI